MAAEYKDFRGKITLETDVWLEAESRDSGRDKSEIVRELLHDRAVREIHKATLLSRLARGQGLDREDEGSSGSTRERGGK